MKSVLKKNVSFKELGVRFPDIYRAQYVLKLLEAHSEKFVTDDLPKNLSKVPLTTIVVPFFSVLAQELDQILLPTVIHEISVAKKTGCLKGETPASRYESFFIEGSKYTDIAKTIPLRYPLLLKMVDGVIKKAILSARECLSHLSSDFTQLVESGFINKNDHLISLNLIENSDPHQNNRAFLLEFISGKKVLHKSVDLHPDQLFREFLEYLDLKKPYDLRSMRVIPKEDRYGWIEYIPYKKCETNEQIRNFYRRSGGLIAIADYLNFTDGHFENLIANGEYPVLIDGETFFQNYAIPERKSFEKKTLLATSLIQKPPKKDNEMGYSAALQAPPYDIFEVVYPFAINDQTDQIKLKYRGIKDASSHNCPSIGNTYFPVHKFVEDILEGFSEVFDVIHRLRGKILSNKTWWDRLEKVRSRTLLRDTLAYYYLIRRIQRPESLISEVTMRNILEAKLGETIYTPYEIRELIQGNVPYFYQHPGKKYLYQGDGVRLDYLYLKSGVSLLKEQFKTYDESYKQSSIAILKKQLNLTPQFGKMVLAI